VLRAVDAPVYEAAVHEQIRKVRAGKGEGDLASLLRAGDVWDVR
jgi:hypothetical protein